MKKIRKGVTIPSGQLKFEIDAEKDNKDDVLSPYQIAIMKALGVNPQKGWYTMRPSLDFGVRYEDKDGLRQEVTFYVSPHIEKKFTERKFWIAKVKRGIF